MFNLEEINQTETQAATKPLDTFQPQDNPLSAIKSMDGSRNNTAVDDMLGNCLIAFEDPQPTPTPDAQKDASKEKTEDPAPTDKTWEEFDKLRIQAILDCRKWDFKAASEHVEQARVKYLEFRTADPVDTQTERDEQKITNNQLSQIRSVIINKTHVPPDWVPWGGLNLPSPELVTPKPKPNPSPMLDIIKQ